MTNWTRRDVIGAGLAAAGASAIPARVARALDRVAAPDDAPAAGRERLLLDDDWRFLLGHYGDAGPDFGGNNGNGFNKAGDLFPPSNPKADLSGWAHVTLPHDWAIELPFVNDERVVGQGFKPLHRAYPDTSTAWYRRTFTVPASDLGRRISIEFDGVFRDCTVALNGQFLGRNLSGYAPFSVDATSAVNYGGENILVVHVDASQHEGWFYEGAGIYRHVWLVKTHPVHVPQWGTWVIAEVERERAKLLVRTEVANDGDEPVDLRVTSVVLDGTGREVARVRDSSGASSWSRTTVAQLLAFASPLLWSPDAPHLYTLVTTLEVGGVTVDRYETPFGVRTVRFDPAEGLLLNGQRVEIKGTCNHQDHAGVGSAVPDAIQEFRVRRLKDMGTNAYRTSHNMPTAELLDACDRLGMMVLDETRMFSSTEEGLSQLERLIRRDRNRPSVIGWSIANEEFAVQGNDRGVRIAAPMVRLVRRMDPTRPVVAAMDQAFGQGISTVIDVQGFNYRHKLTDAWHETHRLQPSVGTETGSTVSTRGIYETDKARGYVSAYDVNAMWWSSTAEEWWTHFAARKWLAGGFIWTGFDYRGEPTPYGWPCISSHFGVMDTCGFPKDEYYYYQAQWGGKPLLHLFPHWNWAGRAADKPVEVWCHTNLPRVELFLDGRSLGTRDVAPGGHAVWQVPWAPGNLEARGRTSDGKTITSVRETTGPAARLVLTPDRARLAADGEDATQVACAVVDAAGRVVPDAGQTVTFTVNGGRLLGVGNGDPSSHESDLGPTRSAFNGLCAAVVQAPRSAGVLTLQASAPGLASATVALPCAAATLRARA